MNKLDLDYQHLVEDILKNGVKKETRNGGTISVFGRQIRHKMSEGFPLLTTKKLHWKSIVTELIWFLRGDTNIKYLVDNNCHIWDGDAYKNYCKSHTSPPSNPGGPLLSDNLISVRPIQYTKEVFINKIKTDDEFARKWGELGEIYGAGWRRWKIYKPIKIERKIREKSILNIQFPPLNIEKNIEDDFIGKKFYSNKSQEEFIVVKKVEGGKNSKYLIQFQSNGYSGVASRPNIKKGQVTNIYKPYIEGVAFLGNPDKNVSYYKQSYDLWYNMIARCYRSSNPFYKFYGEKGIFVESRWLCFEYFLEDIKTIANFNRWVLSPKEFDLDKDYYGSNCYSKDTCYFLPKYENITLKHYKPFIAKNINTGEEVIEICQKHFALKYNLKPTYISYRLNSNSCKPYNGWVFNWLSYDKSKYVWRYQLYLDQIQNLINDLKTNPDSRRLMVNAWNVGEIDQMVLPPCHYGFQVYTRELSHKERCDLFGHNDSIDRDYSYSKWLDDNGFPKRAISLMWNQRSVDTGLGLPFNIASYGLLLEIIAKAVNMVPDELIGNLGDTHLYLNHVELIKEQFREPYPLPILNINTEFWPTESGECGVGPIDALALFNSFDDDNFCKCLLEDIQLVNYQSHPTIKLPLSN
jgi:thymidylate synthase